MDIREVEEDGQEEAALGDQYLYRGVDDSHRGDLFACKGRAYE